MRHLSHPDKSSVQIIKFQIILCRLANLLVSFFCYLISSFQATDLNLLRMNVAVNKFFLCLDFSQTTCLVLWITEKFETRNTKILHNKQHIQVNHPTMVFATPFPLTFLTLNVVSPTQCIKGKLMGDIIFPWNTTQSEQCLIPL